MKTIAQWLEITKFPFKIKDKNGNFIYVEDADNCWVRRKYDEDGNLIYCEYSTGYWAKTKYDENRNKVYFVNSDGYWSRMKYNKDSIEIYYENSDGVIRSKSSRKTVVTMDEVAKKFGIPITRLKIKK